MQQGDYLGDGGIENIDSALLAQTPEELARMDCGKRTRRA
jgi:hypothetical protein